jgi:hypothetical protein
MRSKLRLNHKYMECKYDKGKSGNLRLKTYTEFQLQKNYVKGATQTGINRLVIAAGMVEENHNMTTTMKLHTTQFRQIDKSQFKAPEFAQISGYINTPNNNSPITLSSLKGKVVLVYIWTYTCINSILLCRTFTIGIKNILIMV